MFEDSKIWLCIDSLSTVPLPDHDPKLPRLPTAMAEAQIAPQLQDVLGQALGLANWKTLLHPAKRDHATKLFSTL